MRSGEAEQTLVARLATMWASPSPADDSPARARGRRDADATSRALTAELGEEAFRTQLAELLLDVADAVRSGRPMSESELLLADAALALAAAPDGPVLPRDVIRRVVRDVPPALAYLPIGRMVDRFLERGELVATLLDALERSTRTGDLADALTGVRLYQQCGRADPIPEATAPLVDALERRVTILEQSPDAEIARLARLARSAVAAYRRR